MLGGRSVAVLASIVLIVPFASATAAGGDPGTPSQVEWQAVEDAQRDLVEDLEDLDSDEGALEAARQALDHRRGLVGDVLPAALAPSLDHAAANLELAERLHARGEGAPSLADAVERARLVSRAQAEVLGVDGAQAPPTPDHDRASQAVLALVDHHGLEPTAEQRAAIEALDERPDRVVDALADLADAFLGLQRATEAAFADADARALAEDLERSSRLPFDGGERPSSPPATLPAPGASLAAAGVDLGPIHPARERVLDAALDLQTAIELTRPLAAGSGCSPVQVAPVASIELGGCDSTYEQGFVLAVDAGGQDTYHNNAGGNGIAELPDHGVPGLSVGAGGLGVSLTSECPLRPSVQGGAAALVDLGPAPDRYGRLGENRNCGFNGGAFLGAGLLVDAGGADRYAASGFGVNGGGVEGAGLLVDAGAADDLYVAAENLDVDCPDGDCEPGTSGINGGSNNGLGLLVDQGGDDTYRVGVDASVSSCPGGSCELSSRGINGGGNFEGAAGLVDAGGHDRYVVGRNSHMGPCVAEEPSCAMSSFGVNGAGRFAAVGFLLDEGGRDLFEADATLASCESDECIVSSFGVNGGGRFGGVGSLFNLGDADDVYTAQADVPSCPAPFCTLGTDAVNGGGATGVGLLVEPGGDDAYTSALGAECSGNCELGGFGVNGGANLGAAAFLVDTAGDDRYASGQTENCSGDCMDAVFGVNGGGAVATGFLFDARGDDVYRAGDLGSNGGGVNEGVGLLLDAQGTDTYEAGEPGTGVNGGGVLGVGALVDGAGAGDAYVTDAGTATDETVAPKGLAGAQLDTSDPAGAANVG